MQRKIKVILTALSLEIILAGLPVFAQAHLLKANIPFRFFTGDTELAAGEYTVRLMANGSVLQVQSADGRKVATVFGMAAPFNGTPQRAQLVFKRYGKDCFLSKILWPDYGPSVEIPRSPRELEIVRMGSAESVSVSTSHP